MIGDMSCDLSRLMRFLGCFKLLKRKKNRLSLKQNLHQRERPKKAEMGLLLLWDFATMIYWDNHVFLKWIKRPHHPAPKNSSSSPSYHRIQIIMWGEQKKRPWSFVIIILQIMSWVSATSRTFPHAAQGEGWNLKEMGLHPFFLWEQRERERSFISSFSTNFNFTPSIVTYTSASSERQRHLYNCIYHRFAFYYFVLFLLFLEQKQWGVLTGLFSCFAVQSPNSLQVQWQPKQVPLPLSLFLISYRGMFYVEY